MAGRSQANSNSEFTNLSLFDLPTETPDLSEDFIFELVEPVEPPKSASNKKSSNNSNDELEDNPFQSRQVFKSPEQYKQDFIKLFDTLTYSRDRGRVFSDWAEVAGIWLHNAYYHPPFNMFERDDACKSLEERYKEVATRYKPEELEVLGKMTGIVGDALAMGKSDFVGSLYEELEVRSHSSKQWNGQFLTPYTLSKMMARMIIDASVDEKIKEKGFITVDEPASGAGGMLIAVAEVLDEKLHDSKQCMIFQSTDIDRLAFNMTYIQMSLLGIPGVVRHGDTISLKIWESRPTPDFLMMVKHDQIKKEGRTFMACLAMLSFIHKEESSYNRRKSEKKSETSGVGFGEPKKKHKPVETKEVKNKQEQKTKRAKTTNSQDVQLDIFANFDITIEPQHQQGELF